MKLVLLSGGSGKRLWPLSNDTRSKQFLKILQGPNNEFESMVQRVWRQLTIHGLIDSAYVSTNQTQIDMIQSQLGTSIPYIIEPGRRDTFPAITLATTYLHSVIGIDRNEVIIVMPVDLYVENHFYHKLKEMETVLHQTGMDMALIGVTPTFASTNYGYITPEPDEQRKQPQSYQKVAKFVEKPTEERANHLIQQKSLWNCGVFAFTLGYMMDQLKERGLSTQYQDILGNYDKLPAISFDYEIVEKADQVIVIPSSGDWKDLGNWNALTQNMQKNLIGKGHIGKDCTNSTVINDLDIPAVVLGVSNVVVVASPDGILVSEKSVSHQVKEVVKVVGQRPMFEERRWGWYRVLDYKKCDDGFETLTKRIGILSGKNLSYQYHHKRSEVWVIVSGQGEFILDGKLTLVKVGDILDIPVGAKHGIKAITDVELIEVQTGSELVEEDIVRLAMTWEDAGKFTISNGTDDEKHV